MPLGVRDVLLVLRAKDQASRIVAGLGSTLASLGAAGALTGSQLIGVGAAVMGIGAGMTAVGAAGISFFMDAAESAKEFNRAAALTLTQVDQQGVSLEKIKQIAKDVAREVPAAFEQMQPALYDIFSSMDVTVGESQILLDAFAKAAVAGQVEVQDAARASISIMNAWGLGVEDLNWVMDVQFQLVRKGVGTYDEFAATIGRAIPSAARFGQSFDQLAASLAFLTRIGISPAMSATSIARAMDALAHPKTIGRLDELGIAVRGLDGEFRPMNEILSDMNDWLGKMSAPDRAEALQNLFKGSGGTIRARRFFDQVFKDFDEYEQRVGEMQNVTGAMGEAYGTMYEESASQWQLLMNNLEILKVEMGDTILPVINSVVIKFTELLQAWNAMDPETKKIIVSIAAIAAVLLTVVGVVTMVVGGFIVLAGLGAMIGVSLGVIIAVIAGVSVALLALAAAVYWVIDNWETVGPIAEDVWNKIREGAITAWNAVQDFWNWLQGKWEEYWPMIRDGAISAWESFSGGVQDAYNSVVPTLVNLFVTIVTTIYRVWSFLTDLWDKVAPIVEEVGDFVLQVFNDIKDWIEENDPFGDLADLFTKAKDEILPVLDETFQTIDKWLQWFRDYALPLIEIIVGYIVIAFQNFFDHVKSAWDLFGDDILSVLTIVWNTIVTIFSGAIDVITGLWTFFLNLLQGEWGEAWAGLTKAVSGAWQIIHGIVWGAIKIVFQVILGFLEAFATFAVTFVTTVYNWGKNIISGIWNGISEKWTEFWEFWIGLWWGLTDWFTGFFGIQSPSTLFAQYGGDIINGLWQGIQIIWSRFWNWFTRIADALTTPFRFLWNKMYNAGYDIIRGLWEGIQGIWNSFKSWWDGAVGTIADVVSDIFIFGSPSKLMRQYGEYIGEGLEQGLDKSMANAVGSMSRNLTAMEVAVSQGTLPVVNEGRAPDAALNNTSAYVMPVQQQQSLSAQDIVEALEQVLDRTPITLEIRLESGEVIARETYPYLRDLILEDS